VRRLCRDDEGGTFTLRQYGRKVREMIADHLEGPEIDQVIPPVSLTALTFDDAVRRLPPQEAAAEMGHALRFHLEERTKREDPAKYERLFKRLEEILRTMPGRVHLIDYVIAHELAHVKVSGHREDFWRLLRTALPEYEERRADLDELGRRLWMGDIR
jgi:hypothetical protein